MANYPEKTNKVLKANGHVGMKEHMALASKPHGHFQEGSAPGTRSVSEICMANGGEVPKAFVGNPAAPGVKGKGGNPITATLLKK